MLNRDHEVMVKVRCRHCSRVLADVYGSAWRPMLEYAKGAFPRVFVANEPGRQWKCQCGSDIPVRADRFIGAYREAAAKQGRDRVIMLPFTDHPD